MKKPNIPSLDDALRMAMLMLELNKELLDSEDRQTFDSLQTWYEENKPKKSRRKN